MLFTGQVGDIVPYKTLRSATRPVQILEIAEHKKSVYVKFQSGIKVWVSSKYLKEKTKEEVKEKYPYYPEEVGEVEELKELKVSGTTPTFNVSIDKISTDFMQTTVKKILDEEANIYTAELQRRLQPQVIIVDKKEILIDKSKHYMFKEVLYKCTVHKQVFLAGPTGSGKTTLAAQIAEAMGTQFYFISCSAGMSEAHLLGRMLFDGTYASSDLVRAYEEGGIFLFDEIDAADNNTLLVINSALANNRLSIPNRKDKPYANRHDNFVCIVAGNSWGEGSIQYQGRSPLDRAFLDRFAMSKVLVDYDGDLEKLITATQPQICRVFHELRGFLPLAAPARGPGKEPPLGLAGLQAPRPQPHVEEGSGRRSGDLRARRPAWLV
jgi:energy-coupling factor transporter ATP-binding protein EcfA2